LRFDCWRAGLTELQVAQLVSGKHFVEICHDASESTVQKWEAGTKRPSGMALKLLAVVEKHGLKMLA